MSNKMYLSSSHFLFTSMNPTNWVKKRKNNSSQIDPKFFLDLQHMYAGEEIYIYLY